MHNIIATKYQEICIYQQQGDPDDAWEITDIKHYTLAVTFKISLLKAEVQLEKIPRFNEFFECPELSTILMTTS